MSKKLFMVSIHYTLMVVAENEALAENVGEQFAGEDGAEPDVTTAAEAISLDQIPSNWQDSLPFGTKDDRSCRRILEAKDQSP